MLSLITVLLLTVPVDHPDARPFPAYKIAGNLYYVGTSDITSYLVTTPAGHIIINSGYEETPEIIRDNVQSLGFKMSDVKILLNSQAHFDHTAGMAALQKMTGAKVYSSIPEVAVLESGGKADFRFGSEHTYPPVKVDHKVADGEAVTLGGVTLTAHVHGGHSVGCTTWTMRVENYDVVIVGGTGLNPGVQLTGNTKYPTIVEDFARTFKVLRGLHCDIFLGAHGGYYGMKEKYERMKRGEQPNPFIDPGGYAAYVQQAERAIQEKLKAPK